MALLFVLLLTLTSAVPAFAAEKVTLSLQMRIGSTSALVNGEKETIEKPFVQNGTTLVPLGVFQRTFGTSSRLEGENLVRLSYGSRSVTFAIGGKSATVNGKKVALAAAPVMKNGTLMVPMRPVTDMLGAEVKFASGSIVVTLKSDNGIPGRTPTEEEKTTGRVGSSYADWSIDYPAGATAESNGSEFSTIMGDADGTYVLQVQVWDEGADASAADIQEQLEQEAEAAGETVVDSEIVSSQVASPYARVITLDSDGVYWQSRRYYEDGRAYSLYLGDSTAAGYADLAKWDDLLNSFRPTFATPGTKTEDVSGVKGGLVSTSVPDYGATLEVPVGWTPTDSSQREYEGEDGSVLTMDVVSAGTIKTLQEWHTLLQSRADEIFLPGVAQPIAAESTKAAGEAARIEKLTYDLGSGVQHWNWLVLKKGDYLYILRYSAPQAAYNEQTFRKIVNSLAIEFETVPANFGKLGQISYLKDKSLSMTISNNDFRMSVPAYWSAQPIESAGVARSFLIPGGLFRIDTVDAGLEAASARAVRDLADRKLDDATLTTETPKHTTFAGVPAIRIAYKGTDGSAYQAEDVYFRHGETTYRIHYELDQGAATSAQLAGIERALQSFAFLKPIMNSTK
ncbi:hypothetical protein CDO73_21645 [Saccharibacillus sp. O23]|nr:hypothetical protein CDO73_21645 [Saccharibacillus sp. O23]